MKISDIKSLAIPAIKVVRFARFVDFRGYFTEPFRKSDFSAQLEFMKGVDFLQFNESFSRSNVVRGLHFQWNPFMGKLVRTVQGRMVDLFLDIRKGSPTYGKAAAYDIPSSSDKDYAEWIWIPPGFAHGNYFTQESTIEYFVPANTVPAAKPGSRRSRPTLTGLSAIQTLKAEFDAIVANAPIITDKDKNWAVAGRLDGR